LFCRIETDQDQERRGIWNYVFLHPVVFNRLVPKLYSLSLNTNSAVCVH